MIANNSVRSVISTIHLGIAIFCFCIFMTFAKTGFDSFAAIYDKKGFYFGLFLGIISVFSFGGFLSWRTTHLSVSKKINYCISILFLIEFVLISDLAKGYESIIAASVFTIPPSLFLFLLAYSTITQDENDTLHYNNSLDSNLFIDTQIIKKRVFWQLNRIVSLNSLVFGILLFLTLISSYAPTWTIFIPCIFLISGVILWLFPKIGSWIFSVSSTLVAFGIPIAYLFIMLTNFSKIMKDMEDKNFYILLISIIILSVFILCISLAMLLLSKEAKEEWKK